jgi:hypothetical protein
MSIQVPRQSGDVGDFDLCSALAVVERGNANEDVSFLSKVGMVVGGMGR